MASEEKVLPPEDVESESSSESEAEEVQDRTPKSALKKAVREPEPEERPVLPEQPEPKDLDLSSLTPSTDFIIARQATINSGTIGHVAHGKSTVVKAISGVQTVRFKNELERNITYVNYRIAERSNVLSNFGTLRTSSWKAVDVLLESSWSVGI